ncbi:DUF4905 domain-containing protein [Chlorobium phaeobacteroides]|nr:DUF4905 domain-containing protein [Chlorobium phaeobacteroides]
MSAVVMNNGTMRFTRRWSFHAGEGALVWQLVFPQTGEVVGQKLLRESRRSLFFSLDSATGRVLFDDLPLIGDDGSLNTPDGWYTGIETTAHHLVYCYCYQRESPEHLGLWAIDPGSGQVVWARRDVVFVANLEETFLVYTPSSFGGFPERHYLLLDPLAGSTVRTIGFDSMTANALRREMTPEEDRQGLLLPQFVSEGMVEETLALRRAGIDAPQHCECIVLGPLLVAARYEPSSVSGRWNTVLGVWFDAVRVYEEVMEKDGEKPCLNNFLIRDLSLYYIKEKEELISVSL